MRLGDKMILAGDIGGTHTRLAFFDHGKKVAEKKYSSQKFSGLTQIVRDFLGKTKVSKACFGIAGAVREGRCQATNLPWIVDGAELGRETGIQEVQLLNDLEANAYGIQMLKAEELVCLQKGQKQNGNQALIAAGTGLGEAGLFWDGSKHVPFACEGGHADFAPRTPEEAELLFWLQAQFGHVSYERVVSGPGLHALYRFLIETKREIASIAVEAAMETTDPSRVISEHGRLGQDKACVRALEWFVSLYGAEAGNLALKALSLGGFYIGGGIAPHLVNELKQGSFLTAFANKGRFKAMLQSVPIYVILNDDAALLGAAHKASIP